MKWHTVQGNTSGAASTILEKLEMCNKGDGIYFARAMSWFVWYIFVPSDREYPRLGQMIVDYENPLKKMMEEFVPHGKVKSARCGRDWVCLLWHVSSEFSPRFFVYDRHCQMRWSPCRWCTHAVICLQISGGTLSCSVWSVLPVPCSTRPSLTRSGLTIQLKY